MSNTLNDPLAPGLEFHDSAALAEKALSWYPADQLPAGLQTGHDLIDREHRMLLTCLGGLQRLCIDLDNMADCMSCSAARRHDCEQHLVAMLGDLLAFILDHFQSEEKVMRDSLMLAFDQAICEAHMEDHANISTRVQQIVMALEPNKTVVHLRELKALIERWIVNHIRLHDLLLVRWIAHDPNSAQA